MYAIKACVLLSITHQVLSLPSLSDVFNAISFSPTLFASTAPSQQTLGQPYEHAFPNHDLANTTGLFPMPRCKNLTIEEVTIDRLQQYLTAGSLTSQQLVICYLQRMWQTQDYINSVLELNPDVFQIAAQSDAERQAGHVRGPLHGIPFTVKDNIATKDRMQTTAGSWALQGSVVPRDAHVVAKLRDAGAVLFGKATLSEWADMRTNLYSEGYSGRGGQARSPYNFTVNPGGSSSGSAIGVAGNVVPFSLGTETDGSVINPAERNAVVGFKPTVGMTSRAGVVPESEHQDTVGTFGKTVKDAVYAFDAIYGPDSRDNYTAGQVGKTPEGGYMQFMTGRRVLQNATFGIPWDTFWTLAPPSQQAQLLDMVSLIQSAGARIVNHTELPSREQVVTPNGWDWDYGTTRGYPNESEYSYIKVDFYNNIRSYLAELNNTEMRGLEDLVAFNYANDGTEGGYPYADGKGHPAFTSGQDGFLASLASKGVQNETYFQALAFCQEATRQRGIDAALAMGPGGTQLDALLVPPDVAPTCQVAAQAQYPMITLPAGVGEDGMPFGMALMQTAWREDLLVKWGSAIEDLVSAKGRERGLGRTLPRWKGYLERNLPVT